MPIDPKKFKKVLNNHFDNLSKEEFLKILHKSSPYLFDGSSGVKHDILSSDLKSRWDRVDGENYTDH